MVLLRNTEKFREPALPSYEFVVWYDTPGQMLQAFISQLSQVQFDPWMPEVTRELTTHSGYEAIRAVWETPDYTSITVSACLNLPAGEPTGAKAALSTGLAGLASSFNTVADVGQPYTRLYYEARFTAQVAFIKQAVDRWTNGSTDDAIVKTITAASDTIKTLTAIIPVATDTAWFVMSYMMTLLASSEGVAYLGQNYMIPAPAQSNQMHFTTIPAATNLEPVVQAIKDASAKTTIVGFNEKGPLWAMESSEIIEVP